MHISERTRLIIIKFSLKEILSLKTLKKLIILLERDNFVFAFDNFLAKSYFQTRYIDNCIKNRGQVRSKSKLIKTIFSRLKSNHTQLIDNAYDF